MKRPIAICLTMTILAGAGCDRKPAPDRAQSTDWTGGQQGQPAPKPVRSIMRPAVANPEPAPAPPPPAHAAISFADPSPALSDAQKAVVDGLLPKLAGTTDRIVLRGSTDSRGSDKRNLAVALRRARMVATYLEQKGIARDRISVIALGESRPVAPNMTLDGQDDPEGRARNRRVDIDLVPQAAKNETQDPG